jgi:hypothetical protein
MACSRENFTFIIGQNIEVTGCGLNDVVYFPVWTWITFLAENPDPAF